MKRRENLLRLKRFRADELKRRSATLETMSAEVERKLMDLEEAVAREKQRANDSDIGRLAFPSFLRAMDARRENLKATLKDIGRERTQAALELDKADEELKALELTAEQETRRAAETHLRRSRMRLDELALSRQLRKHALRQI
jgi:F0F1-type ATP synthase membrane subunit b/b'